MLTLCRRLKNTEAPNPEEFYAAWPDVNRVDDRWRPLLQPLYTALAAQPAFYSHSRGGEWVGLQEAVLEAFESDVAAEVREAVTRVYSLSDQSLVRLPDHVASTLRHLHLLQATDVISAGRLAQLLPRGLPALSRAHRLHVLLFLGGHHDDAPRLLRDQELLPLADGTFAAFEGRAQGSAVIRWCQDDLRQLFPGLEAEFCDSRVPSAIRDCLHKLALSGKSCQQSPIGHQGLPSRVGTVR